MEITAEQLEKEIEQSKKPVLIEFWGSWCPPCQMMVPVLEEINKKYKQKIKVFKINADQNPVVSEKFKIKGVPVFLIFRKGKEQERLIGSQAKKNLEDFIQKYL